MNTQVLNQVSEASLQQTVGDMLGVYGWYWIHSRPGRRRGEGFATPVSGNAAKGWPDIFATRGHEAIALELKSMKGRVSRDQADWLLRLQAAGIETRVVRPSDLDWLEQRLKPAPSQLALTTNSTGASWHPSIGRNRVETLTRAVGQIQGALVELRMVKSHV
jgi:hypothetical protein